MCHRSAPVDKMLFWSKNKIQPINLQGTVKHSGLKDLSLHSICYSYAMIFGKFFKKNIFGRKICHRSAPVDKMLFWSKKKSSNQLARYCQTLRIERTFQGHHNFLPGLHFLGQIQTLKLNKIA